MLNIAMSLVANVCVFSALKIGCFSIFDLWVLEQDIHINLISIHLILWKQICLFIYIVENLYLKYQGNSVWLCFGSLKKIFGSR